MFSSCTRIATFFSTASRYEASALDVAGAAILPSDVASRKATECDNPICQVCSFVQRTEDFLVIHASDKSILAGTAKLSYISRAA